MTAVALALDEEIDATVGVSHARQDVTVAVAIKAHTEETAPPGTVHVDFNVHDTAVLEAEVEVGRGFACSRTSYARAAIGIPNGETFVGRHIGATDIVDVKILR